MLPQIRYIVRIFICLIAFIPLASQANERNLPSVKIITRAQRGADESWRIYKPVQTNNTQTDHTDDTTIIEPTVGQTATAFLEKKYPEDLLIDTIETKFQKEWLIRPQQYRKAKKAIIIHHTASDPEKIKADGIVKHLQNMYLFHTKTRGRGDIGYHFLIDEYGNIYEGRAGGEDVVGAHTKRNNPNTIGIALVGNFEIQDPTEKQLATLIKLSAAIADHYHIDPDQQVTFHQQDAKTPFIKQLKHPTIIGHKDAGNTSCPGTKLYQQLPSLRKDIKRAMLTIQLGGEIANITHDKKTRLSNAKQASISLPFTETAIEKCELREDQSLSIDQCKLQAGSQQISLLLTQNRSPTYGNKTIVITDKNKKKHVYYSNILWQQDIANFFLFRQTQASQYISKNITSHPNPNKKIASPITSQQLKELTNTPVNVLLYEASTSLSRWNLVCSSPCTIEIFSDSLEQNQAIYTASDIRVSLYENDNLHVALDQKENIFANGINIKNKTNTDTITISNYSRKSFASIPRNRFQGSLTIKKQAISLLEDTSKQATMQYVLTNELPLSDYLQGIAESSDQEPLEKVKTMTILSKQYMVHYLHPDHRHPSIPDQANYNAIDDPRSFQKYVGIGLQTTLLKRQQALKETQNQYLIYQNHLAFLPYFNCSMGFTLPADIKRGRTDTPYLTTVIDFSPCESFQGHGVGLAGQGATYMANRGVSYQQILSHYYPGTELISIESDTTEEPKNP